ncbi:MAG: hypothetical protein ABJF23_06445 [Bryobacteraceae bacterium]
MRKLVPAIVLLAAASCSEQKPAAPKEFSVAVQGEAYGLRFENGLLNFCDGRGGRKVDLKTAQDSPSERVCPKPSEANTACSGLPLDVTVRSPAAEANDIVDIGGTSFPLKGRVHDCAADGKKLIVVTASQAVLIDAAKDVSQELSPQGGDRAAVGARWAAWTEGARVRLAPLHPD